MSTPAKKPRAKKPAIPAFVPEVVSVDDLTNHPRNYREHPDDQLEHIVESLKANGFYRNVVTASDLTILAGHGVVKAARKLGHTSIPVLRLPYGPEDERSLKVLTGDNEIAMQADQDDRMLTELLKEIAESDVGLLGTGYSEEQLAALLFVTRPRGEVADFDAAAEWVGMPDFEPHSGPLQIVVSFRNDEDRSAFVDEHDIVIAKEYDTGRRVWSAWWPARPGRDMKAVAFVEESAAGVKEV